MPGRVFDKFDLRLIKKQLSGHHCSTTLHAYYYYILFTDLDEAATGLQRQAAAITVRPQRKSSSYDFRRCPLHAFVVRELYK